MVGDAMKGRAESGQRDGGNKLGRCHWDHSRSAGKKASDGGLAEVSRWAEAIHDARA
jgi:hypothetical protein